MGRSAIEWTDETWNPVIGCSRVSEGCRHCYAEQAAAGIVRKAKGKLNVYDDTVKLVGGEPRWTGVVKLLPERLAQPLGWRRPRRVFVNSMSDLFHEELSNEEIAAVFGVMAAAGAHTFQVLTKRAARMRAWFAWAEEQDPWSAILREAATHFVVGEDILASNRVTRAAAFDVPHPWPLPNVWLGVSVENQAAADDRIPELLRTPAAIRFLSCEPLLGELDLTHRAANRALVGATARRIFRDHGGQDESAIPAHLKPPSSLDWIIAGCESGPGARPANAAWYRSLRDQCAAAGVSFFLKQAVETADGLVTEGPDEPGGYPAVFCGPGSHRKPGGVIGAPYLDGVQHLAFPEVSHAR